MPVRIHHPSPDSSTVSAGLDVPAFVVISANSSSRTSADKTRIHIIKITLSIIGTESFRVKF